MATVDTLMRPENDESTRSHYIDVVGMKWETTKFPGIEMKVLYTDPASGLSTILFRLAPGAEVPLHEHTALEQTYMVGGRLVDHEGECTPGNFVWRPAGSRHIARAPEGAILLSMFMKPNRFALGQRFFTETQ